MIYRPLRIINFSMCAGFLVILMTFFTGCKVVDRLSPNTMVKTYQSVTGEGLNTEFYIVKFQIRARQIGNKVGIDNYLFNLELTSQDKVKPEDVGHSIPSVRLKTLTIGLPGDENSIVIGLDDIENPPDGSSPQIFRDHLRYYISAKDVLIPGEPEVIIVSAELEFSELSNGQEVYNWIITAEFSFSKQMKWFKAVN